MVVTGVGKRTYRVVRAFAVVAGSLVLFGSSANVASAEDGLSIIASVQNQTVDAGVSQKQPVAGVTITVTTPAGAMIGTGVTDVAGLISFQIPARDNYIVTLDTATLPNGFTMIDAAKACNDKYEIAILNKSTPPLLLVPQTYGKKDSLFLINDLIAACNHLKVKKLHFTHFGFIQKKLPKNEVKEILRVMLDPHIQSTIEIVIWDVDSRVEGEFKKYKLSA